MSRLPTASSLDRAGACAASFALPQTSTTSSDASAGTWLHRYLEVAVVEGHAAARALLADMPPEVAERAAAIDLDGVPDGFESEVAFAFDVTSGAATRLGVKGRAYPSDGRIYGTADLVGKRDDTVVVYDLKTGNAPRACDSLQLAFLAVAAARVAGLDEAEVGMLLLRGDGSWYLDRHRLDALDLAAVADRLRSIVARVEAAQASVAAGQVPDTHSGEWCRYCPAARYCPAQSALVRTVAGYDLATITERIAALTDEEAGEAWVKLALVEKLAEGAKKALTDRARLTPIPLPGGKVLRECDWSAEKQDEVAKAALAKLKDELREQGHILATKTTQVRAVTAKARA